MRWHLLRSFAGMFVLNLHGNAKTAGKLEESVSDQNVFDIQQGVAILAAFSHFGKRSGAEVRYAEFLGPRTAKYHKLSEDSILSTPWKAITPKAQNFMFVPQNLDREVEYAQFIALGDVFTVKSVGFVTARDALTIANTKEEIWDRVARLVSAPVEAARIAFDLGKDARDWKIEYAQKDLRASGPTRANIFPVCYRPFDKRFTYYTGQSRGFIGQPQRKVMLHLINGRNLALITCRQQSVVGVWSLVWVSNQITESSYISNKTAEINYVFPLRLPADTEALQGALDLTGQRTNINPEFSSKLAEALGQTTQPSPEDIFKYAHAVFHSPGYRSRYAEFLKIDFPRLPLTSSLDLFHALARLGGELLALHLLESPELDKLNTEYVGGRSPEVEKVSWTKNTVWLDRAQTVGFKFVPEAVWNFHVGCHQVCEKWLKDRKGRKLSADDRTHYQKIVVSLSETIRLMAQIDQVIAKHGGWPVAFAARSPSAEFQQRARAWVSQQLADGPWGTICDHICGILEREAGEFGLSHISETAKAVGAKEDDVHTVLTCLCSGKTPLLAQGFYRQHGTARVVVPPDEVSSFLSKRESDKHGWKEWASGVQVVWVRVDRARKPN